MSSITISSNNKVADSTYFLEGGKHSFAHSLACAAFSKSGFINFVPDIIDSQVLIKILEKIFSKVNFDAKENTLRYENPKYLDEVILEENLLQKSRNVFCLLPALLYYTKQVKLSGSPTGCSIGERPTDWYFDILKSFGVQIEKKKTSSDILLSWSKRTPGKIKFKYPTMTGTVIAIAMASVANGTSIIEGSSKEPSCDDQIECLCLMGGVANIRKNKITITGQSNLKLDVLNVKPDRVHAVTIITAALLTKGAVKVKANSAIRVPEFINFLKQTGVLVEYSDIHIYACFPKDKNFLANVNINAGSEPLFSSDWVAFAALLLATRSKGISRISDDVFPKRFQFVDCLSKYGLSNISTEFTTLNGRKSVVAYIEGDPNKVLDGGKISKCDDIRGSATILLSALVSASPVTIEDDFQLRRGYKDLAKDLVNMGICNFERE